MRRRRAKKEIWKAPTIATPDIDVYSSLLMAAEKGESGFCSLFIVGGCGRPHAIPHKKMEENNMEKGPTARKDETTAKMHSMEKEK